MKILFWIAASCITVAAGFGGSSGLLVEVRPEAYVSPASIDLTFQVANPGEVAASPAYTITGWVRALPGQHIRLTASAAVSDPSGNSIPPESLRWTGNLTRSTGGAVTASCGSGVFSSGAAADLVLGWDRSGIAACAVTFLLVTGTDRSEGSYHARIAMGTTAQ